MSPSRTHITDMLLSVIDNPEINEGDNIIIYYAGHGSSYECSEYLDTENPDYKSVLTVLDTSRRFVPSIATPTLIPTAPFQTLAIGNSTLS